MPFLNYIVNRLFQMVPVILGVSLVGFFAIHLVPGDPIQIMGREVFRDGRIDDSVRGQEAIFDHELGGYWKTT